MLRGDRASSGRCLVPHLGGIRSSPESETIKENAFWEVGRATRPQIMNIKHTKQCCAVALCLGSLTMVSPPAMAASLNDTGIDFCKRATSGSR